MLSSSGLLYFFLLYKNIWHNKVSKRAAYKWFGSFWLGVPPLIREQRSGICFQWTDSTVFSQPTKRFVEYKNMSVSIPDPNTEQHYITNHYMLIVTLWEVHTYMTYCTHVLNNPRTEDNSHQSHRYSSHCPALNSLQLVIFRSHVLVS